MYSLANRETESGTSFDAAGGFIQAGQLFSRRRFEVAARYGQFDPTDQTDRNITREARGALSYYYARHGLKWQSDVGRQQTKTAAASANINEFRSQLQFIF